MLNFQDLPDELVLKLLSYSETKDLISCGQVSKRIRRISRDGKLWVAANLEKKIVKTELLEVILKKGCRILNLCHSTILGTLSSNIKSQLRVLNLSQPVEGNIAALEDLLFSCSSLQELVLQDVVLTPKMAVSICENGKTLEKLNLNSSDVEILWVTCYPFSYFQEIIKRCQELKEVDLAFVNLNKGLTDEDLEFLAKNINPNIEKLNLSSTFYVTDSDIKILLSRCNKIKALTVEARNINVDSWKNIKQRLKLTLL